MPGPFVTLVLRLAGVTELSPSPAPLAGGSIIVEGSSGRVVTSMSIPFKVRYIEPTDCLTPFNSV